MKRNFYSMYCCFLDLLQLASLVLQAVSMKTKKMHRMFLKRNWSSLRTMQMLLSKHILKKSMMYKLLLQTGLLPGRF